MVKLLWTFVFLFCSQAKYLLISISDDDDNAILNKASYVEDSAEHVEDRDEHVEDRDEQMEDIPMPPDFDDGVNSTTDCMVPPKKKALPGRRILFGTKPVYGQFPYITRVRCWRMNKFFNDSGDSLGGGCLIAPSVILTCAHTTIRCNVSRPSSVSQMGVLDLKYNPNYEELMGKKFYPCEQRRRFRKVVLHPDYNQENQENDIAIIFTKEPFDITAYVSTIKLPPKGFEIKTGSMVTAIGWGKTYRDMSNQVHLYFGKMPVRDKQYCMEKYKITKYQKFVFNEKMFCAGSQEPSPYGDGRKAFDTCNGDSGGPIIYSGEEVGNIPTVVGIVSWGKICGKVVEYPGVYTEVSEFLDFIKDTIEANGTSLSEESEQEDEDTARPPPTSRDLGNRPKKPQSRAIEQEDEEEEEEEENENENENDALQPQGGYFNMYDEDK